MTLALFVPDAKHVHSQPVSSAGRVTSEAPLCIKPQAAELLDNAFNVPAMVVWQPSLRVEFETGVSGLIRMDATALDVLETPEGPSIHLRQIDSQPIDRRTNTRIREQMPVALRVIDSLADPVTIKMVRGVTMDVSPCGSHISTSETIRVGSLVEFQAHPEGGAPIHLLAMVMRSDGRGQGIAVSFLEESAALNQVVESGLRLAS